MPTGFSMEALLEPLHRGGTAPGTGRGDQLRRSVSWAAFLTALVCASPAAKGHRPRCTARFWVWQLWRRVVRRPIQVVFAGGWRLDFPPWSELAGITLATGLHEPAEELFALAYVQLGDLVIDVGANLGVYTVACASRGARVAAFEPSAMSRAALERNIALNGLESSVKVFSAALGDTLGSAVLTTDLDVGNHLVPAGEAAGRGEAVSVRTLDAVADENSDWFGTGGHVLLKVDAEGHDPAVLRGARRTLVDRRPVVLVETWQGGTEVRQFLAQLGYRMYRYDFRERRLEEYPATWSGQANFIAIPDIDLAAVRKRIEEAPPVTFQLPQVRWRPPRPAIPCPSQPARPRASTHGTDSARSPSS